MLNLSVIVVNYNSGEIIKDCLASVFDKITGIDFEVIVSDNGSTDGSVEMIKNEFPTVRIVENGINIGFAAANNRAAKIAQGKYIFCLIPIRLSWIKIFPNWSNLWTKIPKLALAARLF